MAISGLMAGLAKTRKAFGERIRSIISPGHRPEEVIESLEEALISLDIGVDATLDIIEDLRKEIKFRGDAIDDQIKECLKGQIFDILRPLESPLHVSEKPFCIMVIGVNGVGKTTVIGKLAHRFRRGGKGVILAAADTFRAAAIEQLEEWGKMAGVDVISHEQGGDPGAVAFDAVTALINRGMDVVIVDTAGRLHTKSNLMEELKKVKRVMGKALPGAPHEVLLVIDATTGQNALQQATIFNEALNVTGIIMTKLDGTAKGGILVSIAKELKIPIRGISVGEDIESLLDFDAREFVDAMI